MDVYDQNTRRRVMQRIRKTNTKPELRVRSVLHRMGYRFRLYRSDLPGNPDIVLPKYRVAVLVHGCFWHQHSCSLGKLPKSNRSYWVPKLTGNCVRDGQTKKALTAAGWKVVTVWECEVTTDDCVRQLLEARLKLHSSNVGNPNATKRSLSPQSNRFKNRSKGAMGRSDGLS
jgi:DNA mismatch endonuclease, patch repair protein